MTYKNVNISRFLLETNIMTKITLKEIAEMAGVSVMTVSNVIRGKNSRVSVETKAKIQALDIFVSHFIRSPVVSLYKGSSLFSTIK